MEVRVGIKHTQREIAFESSSTGEELKKLLTDAVESGAKLVTLTDEKGRSYLIPTDTLAYLEIGSEETRKIGFVS